MTTPHQTRRETTYDGIWLMVIAGAGLVSLLALFGIGYLLFGPRPDPIANTTQAILDADQDPEQKLLLAADPLTIEQTPYTWTIAPRASYRITARIIRSKQYTTDWMASVSPIDLALGWGDLSETTFDDQLNWRQSGRWYFYSWRGDPPLSASYLRTHSANVHIIPANENLELAIKRLQVNDVVYLEGVLVDLEKSQEGMSSPQSSYTSLTRTDQGGGSCEIMYVQRLVVGEAEYR